MTVGYLLHVKAIVNKVGFLPKLSLQKRLFYSQTEIDSPLRKETTEIEMIDI